MGKTQAPISSNAFLKDNGITDKKSWTPHILCFCAVVVVYLGLTFYFITLRDDFTLRISGSRLEKSIQQPRFLMDGLIFSIAVTSTMALELLFDLFMQSNLKVEDKFERFLIIFIAFFPSLMTRIAPADEELGFVYACWHTFQICGFIGPVLSLCCKYVPSYFQTLPSVSAFLFWCLNGVLSVLSFGKSLKSWYFIAYSLSSLIPTCLILRALWPWFKSLRNRFFAASTRSSFMSTLFGSMDEGEIQCFLYWIIFSLVCIASPIAFATADSFQWDHASSVVLCGLVYSNAAFSLAIGLVPRRVQQHMLTLNEQKLSTHHKIVRYISHEIRSPLNVVYGGINFLVEQIKTHFGPGSEIYETLIDTKHACTAAVCIVDDLLDLEKIEAGSFRVQRKNEPAALCIGRFARGCKILAQQKNISLIYEDKLDIPPDGQVFAIHVDRIKFEQVIRNIIVNSIKFTPSGGSISVVLTHVMTLFDSEETNAWHVSHRFWRPFHCLYWMISTPFLFCAKKLRKNKIFCAQFSNVGEQESPRYIFINITDTGFGMSKEQIKSLFGEFVQFDAGVLQGGGGSGLGLWICKEIMRQHGGTLKAYSLGLGHGTTVSLKIECVLVNAMDDNNTSCGHTTRHRGYDIAQDSAYLQYDERCVASPEHKPKSVQESMNNTTNNVIKVLIVDDSHLNRKVVKQGLSIAAKKCVSFQLNLCNLDFSEADDGTTAVQQVQNTAIPYDAIFMDNVMSKMNGTEATRIIRQQLLFCGSIYGVTGNALDDDIADFKMHGADDVLIKPVRWEKLEEVLRSIISQKYENSITPDKSPDSHYVSIAD